MDSKTKRSSPMHTHRIWLKWILILVAVLVVGSFVIAVPMIAQGASESAVIRIPKDATRQNVEDSLRKYLDEDYADRVMKLISVRAVDWSLRHGSYTVSKGDTPYETMRKLSSGAQTPVRLVINGFRTPETVIERITSKTDITPEEMAAVMADPEALAPYGLKPEEAMALFFNDTYEVYWSSSAKTVLDKIGKYYNDFWTPARKEKARALGLTPAEVAVVSSIVDEESNVKSEKGRIGRLYLNRLRKGMKLQADPTVRYALKDFTIKRVKGEHLKADSPYNTYKYAGLPPGPIRTPSKSTVDAVLDSEPSEDIYMCAKEDFSGWHNFAATYDQHLLNAKRYQEELDKRGIE